jgi:hypothetical protein
MYDLQPCLCPPEPILTDCPPPSGCKISIGAQCVFYYGPDLNCSGGREGDSFATILSKLDGAICAAIGNTTLTGDVLGTGMSSVVTSLAKVNSTPGAFGGNTSIPRLTVNEKGLVTKVESIPISVSSGGVTSVGLSAPPAFRVLNSPITNTGSITLQGAGTSNDMIRGDGTLGSIPVTYWRLDSAINLYPNSSTYNLGIGGVPTMKLSVFASPGYMGFDGHGLRIGDAASSANVIIGLGSGTALRSGTDRENIAIGSGAMETAMGGSNTVVGTNAARYGGGSGNVAIGYNSFQNDTHNSNTTIGYAAGVGNCGDSNVAIGANSGNFSQVSQGSLNNTEAILGGTGQFSFSGPSVSAFLAANPSLIPAQEYTFLLTFEGVAPEPYNTAGVHSFIARGLLTSTSSIAFYGLPFTSQGTGTTTIGYLSRQSNSIAIGSNVRSDASNQIRIGNSFNDLLVINQFRVNIVDPPVAGDILGWNSAANRAEWQPASQLIWRTVLTSSIINGCVLGAGESRCSQVTGTCGAFRNQDDMQFVITEPCVAMNLLVTTRAKAATTGDTIITLTVNNGATALKVTIPAGANPGVFSPDNADTAIQLQRGDKIAYLYTNRATTSQTIYQSNGMSLISSS